MIVADIRVAYNQVSISVVPISFSDLVQWKENSIVLKKLEKQGDVVLAYMCRPKNARLL